MRLLTKISWICILCLTILLNPRPTAAAEQEIVRVGWFNQPCYMEVTAEGEYRGYIYEYLRHIAQYTGWEYQFVPGSLHQLEEMLEEGSIDLLGGLYFSEERSQRFDLPELESGRGNNTIFVRNDSPLEAGDLAALDGITVAVRQSQNGQALLEFAAENGLTVEPLYFATSAEVRWAVMQGLADAGASGSYLPEEETRPLVSYAPQPFYFCLTKDSPLLNQLNLAQSAIKLANPYYDRELEQKYLPQEDSIFRLTEEEQAFVSNSPPLVVTYNPDWVPLEMTDPRSEQFSGVVADVFQRISALSGLQFVYLEVEDSGGVDARADIVASFEQDFDAADANGYHLTDPYLSLPMALVKKAGASGNRTAVASYFYSLDRLAETDFEPVFFNNARDCIEAVRQGQADQALVNSILASNILTASRYQALHMTTVQGVTFNTCAAVPLTADPALLSVLNKAMAFITDAEMNEIIIRNSINSQETSLKSIVRQMPSDVLLIFSLLLLAGLLALLMLLRSRSRYARRIRDLLYYDQLTGAFSLAGFDMEARSLLRSAKGQKYFLVDCDIYNFEKYNSLYGFAAGDRLLRSLAQMMRANCVPGEIFARVEADHFVALKKADSAEDIRWQLLRSNADFCRVDDEQRVLISYGVYQVVDPELDLAQMRDCALAAKRTVKGNFEDYIAVYDQQLHQRQLEDMALVSRVQAAMAAGEIQAWFQPQYGMVSEEMVGAEALCRWATAEGVIMPSRFIGLLEDSGLIGVLDLYMFETVCRFIAGCQAKGLEPPIISVNISRVHVFDRNLVDKLIAVSRRHQVETSCIEVEFTESAFLENPDKIIVAIDRLQAAGFRVALDDFGSGYSSLNMLQDASFDVVKLDRGFLRKWDSVERSAQIIRHVIDLVAALGMSIVAEGVETREQLVFLRDNGCHVAQGFLFSPPLPPEEFEKLLPEQRD